MYAGLLTFMAFVVWGVAGVAATFLPLPANRQPRKPEVHYVDFKANGNANDQEVTNEMIEASGYPSSNPAASRLETRRACCRCDSSTRMELD